jgi:hypothetical protein
MRLATKVVEGMMLRSLRRNFRRVCWVGDLPDLPADQPVILYTNHHSFYDGYLIWLMAQRLLKRPVLTWMAEFDRFPFFAASGALPFPPDDPKRRAATLRYTARLFQDKPETLFFYFPEGELHRPEEGLLPFDGDALVRLNRLFPTAIWWPFGIHVTWWGDALPTALLGAGTPHAHATGEEHAQLEAVWQTVRGAAPEETRPLLDGQTGPNESWNLSVLRRLFDPL